MRTHLIITGIAAAAFLAGAAAPMPAAWHPEQEKPLAPEIPPEQRIDINHASIAQLMKVPGMKNSWAGRIVRFRPYYTKQDLLERGVLPADVYDRIKVYVIAHRDKK